MTVEPGWHATTVIGEAPPIGISILRPVDVSAAANSSQPKALHLAGGRHGVLLFHGLSSTPLELQYLGRGLARAGYTVRLPVIPGYSHGLPSDQPTTHRDWVDAAINEFDALRGQCDTLAVGGLCIGALLALRIAAIRASTVSSVLSLSTTLHYDGWANPWTRRLLPLAPFVPFANRIAVREREPFGLKDERLRAWVSAQMRESGGSEAGAAALRVRDLLEAKALIKAVRRGLTSITAPTLLVHARDDDAASPRSAFEVASSVRSQHVHCVLLDDSYHMVSIDKEKFRVLTEMKEFLNLAGRVTASPTLGAVTRTATTTLLRNHNHAHA